MLLILTTTTNKKKIIISHNKLIKINNTFHIPNIIHQTNYTLHKIKTTNHTHTNNYHQTINKNTTLLIKIHTNNYNIQKFTKTINKTKLITLNKKLNIPIITNLNNNSLINLNQYNLPKKPIPQKLITTNINLINFSNNKLLNKPQTKIIINKKKIITHLQNHPLKHTLHTNKITLTTLKTTLHLYLHPKTLNKKLPTLHLLTHNTKIIQIQTQHLQTPLTTHYNTKFTIQIIPYLSQINNNSLPINHLPNTTLTFTPHNKHNNHLKSLTTH